MNKFSNLVDLNSNKLPYFIQIIYFKNIFIPCFRVNNYKNRIINLAYFSSFWFHIFGLVLRIKMVNMNWVNQEISQIKLLKVLYNKYPVLYIQQNKAFKYKHIHFSIWNLGPFNHFLIQTFLPRISDKLLHFLLKICWGKRYQEHSFEIILFYFSFVKYMFPFHLLIYYTWIALRIINLPKNITEMYTKLFCGDF